MSNLTLQIPGTKDACYLTEDVYFSLPSVFRPFEDLMTVGYNIMTNEQQTVEDVLNYHFKDRWSNLSIQPEYDDGL